MLMDITSLDSKNKICLYGMGIYGIKTLSLLNKYKVRVDYLGDRSFEDNDRIKGYTCLTYDDVVKLPKTDTVLIICMKDNGDVVKMFKSVGFPMVFSSDEIFCSIPKEEVVNPFEKSGYRVQKILGAITDAYIRKRKPREYEDPYLRFLCEGYLEK